MTPREQELGRMGRDALLEEIARLERYLRGMEDTQVFFARKCGELDSLNKHLNENVTAVQKRCTELLEELRQWKTFAASRCSSCGEALGSMGLCDVCDAEDP